MIYKRDEISHEVYGDCRYCGRGPQWMDEETELCHDCDDEMDDVLDDLESLDNAERVSDVKREW